MLSRQARALPVAASAASPSTMTVLAVGDGGVVCLWGVGCRVLELPARRVECCGGCGQVSGRTALHAAALMNQPEVIAELVAVWHADVNKLDGQGATPLLLAVRWL